MKYLPRRKNMRLKNYNYSTNGMYFITICTNDMKCILSSVENVGDGVLDVPKVTLTDTGKIVNNRIIEMNKHYDDINAVSYVIMPNHIHMLLCVDNGSSGTPTPTNVNSKISFYVSTLKRMTNREVGFGIWQRSYYDRIIRNEEDYIIHLQYIEENPRKWLIGKDEYYA